MVGMGRFWCSKVLFNTFKRAVGLLVALPADAVNLGYNIAIQLQHRPSVSPGATTPRDSSTVVSRGFALAAVTGGCFSRPQVRSCTCECVVVRFPPPLPRQQ